MSFTSQVFFLTVLVTVFLYYIIPKKYRWLVLLASSCCFYIAAAGKRALLITSFTIAVAYIAAIYIEKADGHKRKKKLILVLGLVAALGILAITKIYKYGAFDAAWFIIPLGISYYTFSIIGYLVDVYSKKQAAERNILIFALFVLFFPKIIQGPISKYRDLEPQLIEGHNPDYQNICYGLQRIVWGYFKKLVIVERALLLTQSIFDGNIKDYSGGGAVLLFATLIATISHYCDFSGYMDIVIGISQLMGIKLDENFKQPFFSKTAAEFWRRWHITLGVWFKDYVYKALMANPLIICIAQWVRDHISKRAGKAVLTVIPLSIVWLLTGLWHNTGISYIIWGCYWGAIIIMSNVFAPEMKKITGFLHIDTNSPDWGIIQTIRTFCIFVGGLLISTLVGIRQLKQYAWFVIRDFGIGRLRFATFKSLGLDYAHLMILIFAIGILWFVDYLSLKGDVKEKISNLNWFCRWGIYAMLFVAVVFLGIYGPGYSTSGFAYAHF